MELQYELIVQNSQGETKALEDTVQDVTISYSRTGSPGKLTFRWHKQEGVSFHEGDRVLFKVNGESQFFGYIFIKEKDRWDGFTVTCYDQTRYLKAKDSKDIQNETAGDFIKRLAAILGLTVGEIADTSYRIPYLILKDKTMLDMISKAIEETLLNTGKIYVFYDDAGKLTLKEAEQMKVPEVIGDESLATDYTYTTSIDKDTYNQVKLVHPNEDTGKGDVYIALDSDNIARWGTLQYYEIVDDNMNPAQIQAKANATLEYYNRTLRSLEFSDCLGIPGLRPGCMVLCKIEKLGDINLNSFLLIEKVTHKFRNSLHLMDLECRMTAPK